MRTRTNIFQNTDGVLIGLYLLLVLMGWLNIYAATYNEDFPSILDINQSYGRQLLWIGTSMVIGLVVLLMDSRFFQLFANVIYILCLVALAGVLVFGTEIKGARSWFTLGSFSLQPSEFAKFGTALAIAKLLGNTQSKIKDLSTTLKAIALILPPALLILLQPDTGSTLVYVSFVFVLYREGLSGNFLLMGLLMIVLFVLALIIEPVDLTIAIAGIGIVVYAVLYNGWKFLLPASALLTLLAVVVIRTDAPAVVMASGVALATIVYAIVMYVKREIRDKAGRMVVLGLLVLSTGFIFSVSYIFNNVLGDHQRTRITVLLGEESKLQDQIVQLEEEKAQRAEAGQETAAISAAIRNARSNLIDLRTGAGWNVNQSKIAIGSGGFIGKGFLQGTQTKYDFVPEQSTDFIFCTVGEEWGFLGSLVVIGLFLFLLIRMIIVAERQKSRFSRVYGYAAASILFIHFTINIAMTIGLAPVIGIPLPFFSYGGSSLWAFTLLLFAFIRLDSERMHVLR